LGLVVAGGESRLPPKAEEAITTLERECLMLSAFLEKYLATVEAR